MINHKHTPASYITAHKALQESIISVDRLAAPLPQNNPAPASSPRALMLMPHPDDECLIGALPLRLHQELGRQVIVVPVTLGSNPERKNQRLQELANACAVLGFDCALPLNDNNQTAQIADLITQYQPKLIIMPHAQDGHPTHQSTHQWGVEAITAMPKDFSCLIAEGEFWHPNQHPNLMVEVSEQTAAKLLEGLCQHVGEISRNPYHLTFPSYLADNVRRGAELVSGKGTGKPEGLSYAMLYHLASYANGIVTDSDIQSSIWRTGTKPSALFS